MCIRDSSIGIAFTEPYETSYTTLFQEADTALGNSKKSGKQCFSEYGVSAQKPDTAMKNILLYTHSRNVASTLKFAYSYPDRLIKVSSVTEIRYALSLIHIYAGSIHVRTDKPHSFVL